MKSAPSPLPGSATPLEPGRTATVALLAEIVRSDVVESTHSGSIAVTDAEGNVLASAGNPDIPVFWRSAAKLHQALPLLMAGGVDRWQLTSEELAVICGSHHGDAGHVRAVQSILDKIGLSPDALRCGVQEPVGSEAAHALIRRSEPSSVLHNTCSGNHAGFLALARLVDAGTDNYEPLAHPVQRRALEAVAQFADVDPSAIFVGVDGCGIPAYRTPLSALATAFARLVAPPPSFGADLRRAADTIVEAVTRHPDGVSGRGELDTECLRAFGGAAICKLGAEAVCAAAFRPSERFPAGVGLAIKIEDGMGNRARAAALLATIIQLELGTGAQRAAFRRQVDLSVKTRRGELVGEIRPVFELDLVSGA